MKTKEELIEQMCKDLMIPYRNLFITKEQAEQIYDEIRASILTPRVVALLKAIGSKPDKGGCLHCPLRKCYRVIQDCPLLTAEELEEITG